MMCQSPGFILQYMKLENNKQSIIIKMISQIVALPIVLKKELSLSLMFFIQIFILAIDQR